MKTKSPKPIAYGESQMLRTRTGKAVHAGPSMTFSTYCGAEHRKRRAAMDLEMRGVDSSEEMTCKTCAKRIISSEALALSSLTRRIVEHLGDMRKALSAPATSETLTVDDSALDLWEHAESSKESMTSIFDSAVGELTLDGLGDALAEALSGI